MSQFFSILMVIVMALSSICGSLTNFGVKEPVSADVSFGLDDNFAGILSGTPAEGVAAAIPAMLEKLTLHAALDPSAMQVELRADGNALLSVAMQKQEDGWALASGILPQMELTVKQETLDQLMAQIQSSAVGGSSLSEILGKIDFQAILSVIITSGLQLQAAFEEKFGAPETGSFIVDGEEYTQKSVSSLTLAEAGEMIRSALESILADEHVAEAFSLFGAQPPAVSALDITAGIPEDADFTVARYTGDAGKSCLEVSVLKDTTGFTFHAANTAKTAAITLLVHTFDEVGVDAVLSFDKATQNIDLDISAAGNGQKVHLKAALTPVAGGSDLNIYATFPVGGDPYAVDAEAAGEPFTLRASVKLRQEAPVFDAGKSPEIIELEKLMNPESEEAQELSAALTNSFKTGLLVTVSKLMVAFPELAGLIDFGSLLSPTVTTQTPVEGPVEVETEEAVPADDPSAV